MASSSPKFYIIFLFLSLALLLFSTWVGGTCMPDGLGFACFCEFIC
ncbi:Defensin-like protein [Medicago truncatula]|uniref:Defensin-like protein n=1 Tax=Medicago truncatula TaxID=3880 RepID=A0A072TMU0_MEDTR|nr:Defensin-like protein [Medicago truncatula]